MAKKKDGKKAPCLRRVEIRNFQRHRRLDVDFDDGVNVIAGRSDLGKSSIVRAIRWVVENRPLKFEMVRYNPDIAKDGGTELASDECTTVRLIFDDCIVERRRNEENVNMYILNDDETEPFEALRGKVPDEIKEALCLDSDNIQRQHDPYFLIQESGSEVAKRINRVANLTIIDDCIKVAGDRERSVEAEIAQVEKRCKWLKKDIDAIKIPERAGELIEEIEEGKNELGRINRLFAALEGITDKYRKSKAELEEIDKWLEVKALYEPLKREIEKLYDLDYLFERLQKAVNSFLEAKAELAEVDEWLGVKVHYAAIVETIEALDKVEHHYQKAKRLRDEARRIDGVLSALDDDIRNKKDEYRNILEEYKICPLCGSEIQKSRIMI